MTAPAADPRYELPIAEITVRERVEEAWRSRALFAPTALSSIPTYSGRVLGRAWLFIVPVMQILSFNVLLSGVFHAQAPNGVPYLLFLIFGMQAYRMLQMTLLYATVSTKMLKTRTRAFRFPLLLIPFASVARSLLMLAVYWVIAAVALVYYGITDHTLYLQLNVHLLVGMAGIVLVICFALAIGLSAAVLYPRARDVRYVIRYALHLWLFFTPVLYSIESLSPTYQLIAQINPLTPLVGMVQWGFLDAGGLRPWGIVWAIAVIVLSGAFGVWFFNRFAERWIGVYQVPDADLTEDDGIF